MRELWQLNIEATPALCRAYKAVLRKGALKIDPSYSNRLGEAIDLIGTACGRSPRMDFEPARPGDQRETSADWTKANHAFGYTPAVSPAEGMAQQVEWHIKQRQK